MEALQMTDNQWKDNLRIQKDDLEELKEYFETENKTAFEKKISKMLQRIKESLESWLQAAGGTIPRPLVFSADTKEFPPIARFFLL